MRTGAIVCLMLFICAAVLGLLQMWFTVMSWETFIKVMITLSVLFVIALAVTLVLKEYVENKELKKNNYID